MNNVLGVFLGLGATFLFAAFMIGLGIALVDVNETAGVALLFGSGLLQLAWLIPLYRHASKNYLEGLKIGLIIGGGLVFLFTAACGALLLSFSGASFR